MTKKFEKTAERVAEKTAEKAAEKIAEKAKAAQAAAVGMMDDAMRGYEQSIRMGLKWQEEAGKWWLNIINQTSSPQEWQRRVSKMAEEWVPATQKGVEESFKLIEENNRAGVDLIKKSMDAMQSTSFPESQARWADFMEASLKTGRANAETMLKLQGRAMDTMMCFFRKATEMIEPKAGRAV